MHLVEDWENLTKKPMRDGYGEMLVEVGKKDGRVVALIADLLDSLRLDLFKKELPDRLIEMGIAEQNMMGVGAGLAMSGKIPFVNSIACFNPGYNWNQLRVSVCLGKENVKIVGGHAGFGNGADGANQQAFEDIALTRVLPNLVVLAPVDYEQVKKAVMAMVDYVGPVYMRITKPSREIITTNITPLEIGKAQVFCGGKDVSVFACGAGVFEAMRAAKQLEGEFEVEVINVHTIKPIDKETLVRSARKTKRVITVEEHSVVGGLGSAVAELLSEECPTRMKRIGMPDCFGESGEPEELMKKYGITADNIVLEIRKTMKEYD
jgi:transketolase